MAANVMIATPTGDGTVHTTYFNAVSKLLSGADNTTSARFSSPYFTQISLINFARNALVSAMLERPEFTHILFVDSDIGFEPSAVHQMLAYDKPFTACSCPARHFDLKRFHTIGRNIDDPQAASLAAQNYVAFADLMSTPLPSGERSLDIHRGFARTRRIGMGLTLLRREVLDAIKDAFPELYRPANQVYRSMGVKRHVLQCFESTVGEDGLYVGEDVSFCDRWTGVCGGEIWLNVNALMTHSGPATFTGRLMDRLRYSGPDV